MHGLYRALSILLIASFAISLSGQDEFHWPKHKDGRKVVSEKFDMLEKTIPNLQNIDFLENEGDGKITTVQNYKREGEVQLSEFDEVEFEVHAIVNPNDPNNIIVGCMNFDFGNVNAPVTFRIYVTKDFGDTWVKSAFTGYDQGDRVLGGGDPMFAFDNNGNLVFSWLHI